MGAAANPDLAPAQGRRSLRLGLPPATREYSWIERTLAISAFAVLVALNVALPSWSIGPYPVRGLLAIGLLAPLSIYYAEQLIAVVRQYKAVIQLAIGLAILGIFVSFINGTTIDLITEALLEVHLQVLVTLLLSGVIAQICGTRACVLVLVSVIAVSSIFAVLQAFGMEAAWHARSSLGTMQAQLREIDPLEKARPTGLSYSPIQLSTQLCLAFAAFAAWRESCRAQAGAGKTQDPSIIAALVAFVVICVASQTRSPIAGALLFFGMYTVTRRGSLIPVLVVATGALLYLLWPSLSAIVQAPPPRVTEVDDDTVWNRLTLATYGFTLLIENPIGYGFDFRPFDLWESHWRDLYALPAAGAIRSKELHNYFLNMANTYGIGLLLFVPIVVGALRKSKAWLIFFVPYLFHITFHNTGPFWNDSFVWFAIAALAPLAAVEGMPQYAPIRRRMSRWEAERYLKAEEASEAPSDELGDARPKYGYRRLRRFT